MLNLVHIVHATDAKEILNISDDSEHCQRYFDSNIGRKSAKHFKYQLRLCTAVFSFNWVHKELEALNTWKIG